VVHKERKKKGETKKGVINEARRKERKQGTK
jgi:hypothetical protein